MELTVNNQLADDGVTIEGVAGSQFADQLTTLFSAPAHLANDLAKFSILLRNDSPHHIMAMTVVWNFTPSSGQPILNTFTHSAMDAIFNKVEFNLIQAGGQQLMCLLAPGAGIGHHGSVQIKDGAHAQQHLAGLNALLARSTKWSVEIDGLLLSNGLFVGPDKTGHFECFRSQVQGARDAVAELAQKAGSPGVLFAHAESYAAESFDDLKKRFPDVRTRMKSPQFSYEFSKRQVALQVRAYRNNGYQAALDFLAAAGKNQIAIVRKTN